MLCQQGLQRRAIGQRQFHRLRLAKRLSQQIGSHLAALRMVFIRASQGQTPAGEAGGLVIGARQVLRQVHAGAAGERRQGQGGE